MLPRTLPLLAVLTAAAAPAAAEVVTPRFEATVQSSTIVSGIFAGTVAGDTIFQDLTYDTAAAPFAVFPPVNPTEAHYQPIFALTSAGRNGQLLVSGLIEQGSFPNFANVVMVVDTTGVTGGDGLRAITYFPDLRFYVQLAGLPVETFDSLALPNFAPPLTPDPTTVIVISGATIDENIVGILSSVTLIPAPSAALVLAAGAAAALCRRRA